MTCRDLAKRVRRVRQFTEEIAARFSDEGAADWSRFLMENDIPYDPWSRIGD